MAHFVAENTITKTIRVEKDLFSQATGEKTGKERGLKVHFPRGVAPAWAVQLATDLFKWDYKPREITVERWCAYVNTNEWQETLGLDDAERELAEEKLRACWPDIIEVVEPPVAAPWPNYDKVTVQGQRTPDKVAEKLLVTAEEIGADLSHMIRYEKQTRNNPVIVAAFTDRLAALAAAETEEEPAGDMIEA